MVDFSGFERVVDSAIPLRTDEILYGRVVAVGDRVELQRLHAESVNSRSRSESRAEKHTDPIPAGVTTPIAELGRQWLAEDVIAVERLAGQAANPSTMLLGASALAKIGLPFSSELVEAVYALLSGGAVGGIFPLRPDAIVIETMGAGTRTRAASRDPAAVAAFAQLLRAEFELSREVLIQAPALEGATGDAAGTVGRRRTDSDQSGEGGGALGGEGLSGALFNVQVEGSVSHAVATLPFIVDGRLVELDVALFQQEKNADHGGALPHGRVVIALNTDHLGRVQIVATLVGDHVHLNLTSDDGGAAEYMAGNAPALRAQVQADGWVVDGIRYGVDEPGNPSAVLRTVLEHVVSGDSFSRLI
jgi:hypothetical protein